MEDGPQLQAVPRYPRAPTTTRRAHPKSNHPAPCWCSVFWTSGCGTASLPSFRNRSPSSTVDYSASGVVCECLYLLPSSSSHLGCGSPFPPGAAPLG
uniref:Uncharacterized protein n=1 Tax=Anopheles albimanus TaxID=7167 RepID=A0A182F3T9_ANOAL